jgi:hypothetical protein
MMRLAFAALAALTLSATAGAQEAIDAENPTNTDCAAVFSIIAEQARETQGQGSEREAVAKSLYTRYLAAAVNAGEYDNRNTAAQSIAVRALAIVDMLETEEGGVAVEQATAACLNR